MTALTFDNPTSVSSLEGVLTPASYVRFWGNSLAEQYALYSTSISSSIDKVLLDLLEEGIAIKNNAEVEGFLKNNYSVVAYLYEAPNKIREYFANADLEIGVFSDPEYSEEQPELYIEIKTALSPEEATKQLSNLNREWLIASGEPELMDINVTLRFL